MHWSKPAVIGSTSLPALRGHSSTVVGNKLYIYGGYDSVQQDQSLAEAMEQNNHLLVFDTETFYLTRPPVTGTRPGCLKNQSATAIENKLYIFGGSDNATYFSDLYVFDTLSYTWSKPDITSKPPGPRRAHVAVPLGKKIVIFGGGDGKNALNETHIFDTEKLSWESVKTVGTIPAPRGYCTGVLYGQDKLIVYGGSDGSECFSDVFTLDIPSVTWTKKKTSTILPSFSHTANLVGSSMLVLGGHNASENINSLTLLNTDFRTETWDWSTKPCTGTAPSARGYHSSSLADNRLFSIGGSDGNQIYSDMNILDLGIYSLLSSPAYLNKNSVK